MKLLEHRDDPRASFERLGGASVAAMLTLAVHLAIFAPLFLGMPGLVGSARGSQSRETLSPGGPWVLTYVIRSPGKEPQIAERSLAPVIRAAIKESLASQRWQKLLIVPTVTIPEEFMEKPSPDPVPSVVRRIGEITARIQAAWVLPAQPMDTDFHCRVRIRQDETGAFSGVDLQSCDSDPQLRASLLAAVHAATPLPARDDAEHAAWDLTLEFKSFAASPGGRSSSVQPSASEPTASTP